MRLRVRIRVRVRISESHRAMSNGPPATYILMSACHHKQGQGPNPKSGILATTTNNII